MTTKSGCLRSLPQDIYDVTEFTLTEEHIKLLRHVYVGWQYCETGAPEINPKRPYGNSYVAGDVIETLGWPEPPPDDDATMPSPEWKAIEERAIGIHCETHIALSIVLRSGSFEPGVYVRPSRYDFDWKRKYPPKTEEEDFVESVRRGFDKLKEKKEKMEKNSATDTTGPSNDYFPVLKDTSSSWRSRAEGLWGILDYIDTLDDSCREFSDTFRKKVRNLISHRFMYADSDGYTLKWKGREQEPDDPKRDDLVDRVASICMYRGFEVNVDLLKEAITRAKK